MPNGGNEMAGITRCARAGCENTIPTAAVLAACRLKEGLDFGEPKGADGESWFAREVAVGVFDAYCPDHRAKRPRQG